MSERLKYTIKNPVMFALVMKDPELCKGLLERIFPGRKVRQLRFVYAADEQEDDQKPLRKVYRTIDPETEKTIVVSVEAKSIRMDVLFEDDDAWYDIEMQVENVDSLPKRSRYYHSIKTVDSLKRGTPYSKLKPGYVIFICTFDLFEMNEPVYSFQMYDEKKRLPMGDGQYTIFLNSACKENVPKELQGFYHYLQTDEVIEGDIWLEQLDEAVEEANAREEVRSKVTLYDDMVRANNYMKMLEEELAEKESKLAAQEEENAAQKNELAAKEDELVAQKEALAAANRLNKLNMLLAKQNRTEDIVKAVQDEEYCQQLMEELGV